MSKAYDRKALLYFARRARGSGRWCYRLWWHAIDLLPYPNEMPAMGWGSSGWAPIAESMAWSIR